VIPGVASWNDASNNKAFLGNESIRPLTQSLSTSLPLRTGRRESAEDIDFGPYPIAPLGKPTELAVPYPLLAMTYTKYPQACKALMAFMMEAGQFNNLARSRAGLSLSQPQCL
jgi:multiple sugar transport system substrate-binding protein